MAASFLVLSFATFVSSVPIISFPISYQIPPVARVYKPFEFIFSPSTFFSHVQPMNYTLVDSPPWLKLDGERRRLHGTPLPENLGLFTARISASDATGSVVHDATFVVSDEPELKIQNPLDAQLSKLGTTDGNGGVTLLSGEAFNFTFADDTFAFREKIQRYEAVSTNNSPLPPWINFNRERVEFVGSAPELVSPNAPPQSFDITLVASDYPGFAGASASFKVIVGRHKLHFSKEAITVNATIGKPFTYILPRESIILDGNPIQDAILAGISANTPDWLSFDTELLAFSGTPTQGNISTKVTIFAHDVFGDEARTALDLRIFAALFNSDLPDFSANNGEEFEFTIDQELLHPPNVKITVELEPKVDWVFFNPKGLKFEGQAPEEAASIKITLTAESGNFSDFRSFDLVVRNGTTTLPTLPTPTSLPNASENETSPNKQRRVKTLTIILAILLPLLVFATLLLVFIRVIHSRKPSSPRPISPSVSDISRPIHQIQPPWPPAITKSERTEPGELPNPGIFGPERSHRISENFVASVNSDGAIQEIDPFRTPPPRLVPREDWNLHYNSACSTPTEKDTRANPINFSKLPGTPRTPENPHRTKQHVSRPSRSSFRTGLSSLTDGGVFDRQPQCEVYYSKTSSGGPPGFGVPKKSLRRSPSPANWGTPRDSDASFETVSTEIFNQLNQPSVRLVGRSDNESPVDRSSHFPYRAPSPFFGDAAWWRTSKMPAVSVTPAPEENARESLIEGVMRSIGCEESETVSLGPRSPATTSPSPLQKYSRCHRQTINCNTPSASPSLLGPRSRGEGSWCSTREGSFTQEITDEYGSRMREPRRSRESGITNYSRTTSSCYPYEPFEYGVAVTSSWIGGPGAEKRDPHDKEFERQEVEESRGQRQKAKLVDTRKRPVSTLGESREGDRNSGYLGHLTFL